MAAGLVLIMGYIIDHHHRQVGCHRPKQIASYSAKEAVLIRSTLTSPGQNTNRKPHPPVIGHAKPNPYMLMCFNQSFDALTQHGRTCIPPRRTMIVNGMGLPCLSSAGSILGTVLAQEVARVRMSQSSISNMHLLLLPLLPALSGPCWFGDCCWVSSTDRLQLRP